MPKAEDGYDSVVEALHVRMGRTFSQRVRGCARDDDYGGYFAFATNWLRRSRLISGTRKNDHPRG